MDHVVATPRTKWQSVRFFWPLVIPFVFFGVLAGVYLAKPPLPQPLYSVADYSVQLPDGTLLRDPAEVTIPENGSDQFYRRVCALTNTAAQVFKTFKEAKSSQLFQSPMEAKLFPVGCFVWEGELAPLPNMLPGHSYTYLVFVSLNNKDGTQTTVVMPGPLVHVSARVVYRVRVRPPAPTTPPPIVTPAPRSLLDRLFNP